MPEFKIISLYLGVEPVAVVYLYGTPYPDETLSYKAVYYQALLKVGIQLHIGHIGHITDLLLAVDFSIPNVQFQSECSRI